MVIAAKSNHPFAGCGCPHTPTTQPTTTQGKVKAAAAPEKPSDAPGDPFGRAESTGDRARLHARPPRLKPEFATARLRWPAPDEPDEATEWVNSYLKSKGVEVEMDIRSGALQSRWVWELSSKGFEKVDG